jgi:hypothetical protein
MLRDLGDGPVLRRATRADAAALAAFNADRVRFQDASASFAPLGVWTRDLLEGRHPTFAPDDGLIVEETRTGAIVSFMLLVPQTWGRPVLARALAGRARLNALFPRTPSDIRALL